MIKATLAFATGCILILVLPTLPAIDWFWSVILNILLFLFKPTRYLALILTAALWTTWHCQTKLEQQLEPALIQQSITLTGIIDSIPKKQHRTLRFNIKTIDDNETVLPKKISLAWYRPYPDNLRAGQHWQLNVKLKPPHGMVNPGGFDYESWLFQQGIGATGYVKQSEQNTKLADPPTWHLNALRQTLADSIEQHLPDSDYVGLIQGLLLGIKHNIHTNQWQSLRLSGTSHLLAISGLHIGLAAVIGFYLFRLIWSIRAHNVILLPAKQFGALGAILFAISYAGLAGFSIPTQRAAIMVTIFMLGILTRKTISHSQLLAIATLVILIIEPTSIISAGFWLSFGAVAIILLVSQHRLPKPKWHWLKIHFFIAFGLTPLLLFFFSQTAFIAPIANFIAVPFVSILIIPLVFLTVALLPIWPTASERGFLVLDTLFALLFDLLNTLSSLPFSNWEAALNSPVMVISVAMATALLLLPKGLPLKPLAVIGFLPLFIQHHNVIQHGEFKLTLLDVGQGLSTVIQTQHHVLVFDTGAKFSEQFNAGQAALIPFLQHQNINHIDTLIISHADNDHIGGTESLLAAYTVNRTLTSQSQQLPHSQPCLSGQSWQWDGITFDLLSPAPKQFGSENNLSCVLKVSNNMQSALLTGDIEKQTEHKLVQQYPKKLASTVLIAPHHGSNTSSTVGFIKAVNPTTVLFPAAYLNRYHFPNKKVRKRYKDRNITAYTTGRAGALSIHFQPNQKLKIKSWRQQSKKIWTSVPTD